MPAAGTLTQMVHVPGDLYSVNPATARGVPGLFARNERVVCVFDGDATTGTPWVLVLVGATIVGSMATTWHGVVNPPRPREPRRWAYAVGEHRLAQGQEMGRFLLGSTVILVFEPSFGVEFQHGLGDTLLFGDAIGRVGTHRSERS